MSKQNTKNGKACISKKISKEELYLYADGELSEQRRAELDAHFARCAFCKNELEEVLWMQRAIRQSAPMPEHDICGAVLEQIRTQDKEHSQRGRGRILAMPQQGFRRAARVVGGIAAALVICVTGQAVMPLLMGGNKAAQDSTAAGDHITSAAHKYALTEEEADAEAKNVVSGGTGAAETQSEKVYYEIYADEYGSVTGADDVWIAQTVTPDKHSQKSDVCDTMEYSEAEANADVNEDAGEDINENEIYLYIGVGEQDLLTAAQAQELSAADAEAAVYALFSEEVVHFEKTASGDILGLCYTTSLTALYSALDQAQVTYTAITRELTEAECASGGTVVVLFDIED